MKKETAEIICPWRNHLPIGSSEKDVVDLLALLLNKAERGELLGLSCAWVEGNNNIGLRIADGSAHAGLLAGAVSALNFEINYRWSGRR